MFWRRPEIWPEFGRVATTLIWAILAAQVCLWLRTPLPWMIGPMLAVSAASMMGAPMRSSRHLRNFGQSVIGCALGLYFTPQVGALVASLSWAIALGIVWALLLGWCFGWVLYQVHKDRLPGVTRATTYFAGAIGGASEMTLLAERAQARTDLVASAHTLRVMLITVLMAGHDAQAKVYFDGLLRTARGRPAHAFLAWGRSEARYLHEWRLSATLGSAGDGWNATDGDLDIALALLMADRQWGSTGAVDYRAEALATIAALKSINFAASGEPRGPQRANTRTSDHMVGHFRAFHRATGDAFWLLAIDRCHALVSGIVAGFSPVAGLQPGFIVDCDTLPVPSPGWLVESAWEGSYDANAIRNPWRWGTDFLFSGDARWGTIVQRMVQFMEGDCGGDPFQLPGMYRLDGGAIGGRYFAESLAGPLMVGCMVDAARQGFLNTLWNAHAGNFTTDYYDSELQLLPMLVASGNWWNP